MLGALLAAVVLCGPAPRAAEESVSETFISYASVINGAGGGSWGLTYLSLQMVRPLAGVGVISAVGASSVADENASWAEDQFSGPTNRFYISLKSGASQGRMVDIAGTDAALKRLLLAEDLTGAAQPGDEFEIRPHFTVDDLFGAGNSSGLQAGPNPETADNIVLYPPGSQEAVTLFYSSAPGNPGWHKSDFTPAGSLVVYPQQGMIVRRRGVNSITVFGTGAVKPGTTKIRVSPGYNVLGALRAEAPLKLADLNIFTGSPATGLAGGRNSKEADNLFLIDAAGATRTYFYSTVPGHTGWHSSTYEPADSVEILPGTAFVIQRKQPNGAFEWNIPAEPGGL
jgi:uncharacterized protein (TIGR02597 family)